MSFDMSSFSKSSSFSSYRRHSSRSIKRRKFDDELVESSLPLKPQRKSFEGADDSSVCASPLSLTSSDATVVVSGVKADSAEKKLIRSSSDSTRKTVSASTASDKKLVKRKKMKKTRQAFAAVKDMGRWKPTDDILLIDAVEQLHDLALVHLTVKFSCHFTLEEVQERWYALLYDPVISALARQAMKSLPFEIAEEAHALIPFSKSEESILAKVLASSKPTNENFQELLEQHPSVFHRLRTNYTLEKHWNHMKQYCLIDDQTTVPLREGAQVFSFSDAEDMLDDKELSLHRDDLIDHEISVADRKQKKEMKKMEEELPRWEVLVSHITGVPALEMDQHTVAVLKGRLVRYLMRSKEASIGRSTEYTTVDIDLSLEGPAYKVSRKQGFIKMKDNGEFILKNEGKRPIFVDGKPVLKGNKMRLHHESVIEITLLSFIFLINQQLLTTKVSV